MAIFITKFLPMNWHVLNNCDPLPLGVTTFVAGHNRSGKSTLLDALLCLFCVTTQGFNAGNEATGKHGKRDLTSYVRARITMQDSSADDDGDPSKFHYLRRGATTTHVVAECLNTETQSTFVIGMTAEARDINDTLKPSATWWSATDCHLEDFEFKVHVTGGFRYATLAELMSLTPAGKTIRKYNTQEEAKQAFSTRKFFHLTDNHMGDVRAFDVWVRTEKNAIAYDPKNIGTIDNFIKKYVLPADEPKTKDFLDLMEEQQNLQDMLNNCLDRTEKLKAIIDLAETYHETKQQQKVYVVAQTLLQCQELERQVADKDKEYEQEQLKKQNLEARRSALNTELSMNMELHRTLAAENHDDAHQQLKQTLDKTELQIKALERKQSEFHAKVMGVQAFASRTNQFFGSPAIPTAYLDQYTSVETPMDNQDYLFHQLTDRLSEISTPLAERVGALREEKRELDVRLNETKDALHTLNNTLGVVGTPESTAVKAAIQREFAANNIQDTPYFLCELLDFRLPDWAAAAEAYMGNFRFSIFVSPENYKLATQVSHRLRDEGRSSGVPIIDTTSFVNANTQAESGTLASVFTAKNDLAREYINHVYGNVKLVHDAACPTDRNATSIDKHCNRYSKRTFIPTKKVRLVIGQEARQAQKVFYERQLEALNADIRQIQHDIDTGTALLNQQRALQNFIVNGFGNLQELNQLPVIRKAYAANLKQYQKFLDRPEHAKLKQLDEKIRSIQDNKASIEEDLTKLEISLGILAEQQTALQKELADYEDQRNNIDDPSTRNRAEEEIRQRVKATRRSLSTIRLNLTQEANVLVETLSTINANIMLGQSKYREEFTASYPVLGYESMEEYKADYDNLTSTNIPNLRAKAERNRLQTQYYFQDTIIRELKQYILNAEEHLNQLNRYLSRMSFNGKIYQFGPVLPADGYRSFFKMIMSHNNVGVQYDQLSFDSISFEDEFAAERAELFEALSKFSTKKDAAKPPFLDYRTYCRFRLFECDAEDIKRRADLDDSLGMGSGSEVQIPCYLVLIAALVRMYSRSNRLKRVDGDSQSLRLLMVDECFDKMDYGNANKMIQFTADLGLQLIAAAPTEKFSTFGESADSVIFAYTETHMGIPHRRCQHFSSCTDFNAAFAKANGEEVDLEEEIPDELGTTI